MREVLLNAVEAIVATPAEAEPAQVMTAVVNALGQDGWKKLTEASLAEVLTELTVGDLINFGLKMR